MTRFDALVEVRLLPGIADPAGTTVQRALPALGFPEVTGVRMGKAIRLQVEAPDAATARERLAELCRRFLTNPVIEEADITLEEAP
ncbi:MAG: phosphoribosylformylglycinamidine synthase subunit PurS [Acidimicrobiales bacterium]